MYYEDLSPYEYVAVNPYEELAFPYNLLTDRVLNIGWLAKDKPYATGTVSEATLERVLRLCFHPVNVCRGCHFCDLCHYDDPPFVEWNGNRVGLGGAEIWVPGKNGIVYAAPNLIYHYIREHSYCPPAEFISAVNEFQ